MSLCPACGTWESKTLETRKDTRYNWTWRRKRCHGCSSIYATYEMPVDSVAMPEPVDPEGKLER
jgi:transcriptional regulator NrdR family protein